MTQTPGAPGYRRYKNKQGLRAPPATTWASRGYAAIELGLGAGAGAARRSSSAWRGRGRGAAIELGLGAGAGDRARRGELGGERQRGASALQAVHGTGDRARPRRAGPVRGHRPLRIKTLGPAQCHMKPVSLRLYLCMNARLYIINVIGCL